LSRTTLVVIIIIIDTAVKLWSIPITDGRFSNNFISSAYRVLNHSPETYILSEAILLVLVGGKGVNFAVSSFSHGRPEDVGKGGPVKQGKTQYIN
jgi:hypothetical protein